MDALARYLLMQSQRKGIDTIQAKTIQEEAQSLLVQLEQVDSDRKERYRDLGKSPFPAYDEEFIAITH
jgi:hypothetical protein